MSVLSSRRRKRYNGESLGKGGHASEVDPSGLPLKGRRSGKREWAPAGRASAQCSNPAPPDFWWKLFAVWERIGFRWSKTAYGLLLGGMVSQVCPKSARDRQIVTLGILQAL